MQNTRKNSFSVYRISLIGIFAALVFICTNIRIPFAVPTGNAMIHFGNIFCLLAGILLGPLSGGLAAGIGSFLFDLLSEYASSAPFTLVFKFIMGFSCGVFAGGLKPQGRRPVRNLAAGVGAILVYQIFYLGKGFITDYYISGYELETVLTSVFMKGVSSVISGIVAAVIAMLLYPVFEVAMRRAGIADRISPPSGN